MPKAPLRREGPKRPRARTADQRRPNAHRRGYGRKWRKYAAAYLARNPLCVRCLAAEVTRAAEHVDHIEPVSSGSDPLFWKSSNHQALCQSCHSRKTATEDTGRGRMDARPDLPPAPTHGRKYTDE